MLLAELTDRPVTAGRHDHVPPAVRAGHDGGDRGRPRTASCSCRRDTLPAHRWHAANGARFDDYGGWRRPAYYQADN
jgi:hypothetical protein